MLVANSVLMVGLNWALELGFVSERRLDISNCRWTMITGLVS
jgi:hypothetical protein